MRIVTPEKWEQVNPENKKLLNEFILTLKQEGRSKSTLETYEGNSKRFLIYVLDHLDNRSVLELRKKDFRNYSLHIKEREAQKGCKASSATHNHYISTIRSWCERLEDDEDIDYDNNMCRKVKGVKIERVKKIVFLTDDQITKLYYELLRIKEYQIAAWLALAYDSTGRRMEIFQVTKESFMDGVRNSTNPVSKKGGKREALVYFERTQEAVRLWLEQRGEDDNPSLWADFGKRKRTVGSANSWCNYMSKILTILDGKKIHFTPHCIRHSAIENLTEGTHYKCPVKRIAYDVKTVQKLASHASSDMTEYYKKDKGMKTIEQDFNIVINQ
jgi:integrase/recombinase XerD